MTTLQEPAAVAGKHPTAHSGARIFVRRLYFYGMMLISLIAGVVALDSLLAALATIWLARGEDFIDAYSRDTIAATGGVLLVATPIFLIHWRSIQGWQETAEKRSALRKFALYIASVLGVGYAIVQGFNLVRGIALLAFGDPLVQSDIWPDGWLRLALMIGVGLGLMAYFQAVLRADGDRGREEDIAGTWRRLYQTAAGVAGLFLVIWGSATLIETLLRAALEPFVPSVYGGWWRFTAADSLAQLLVGSLLLRLNWVNWMALAQAHPHETQTALRRFYLYAAVVGGTLATLVPVARLLNDLLLVAFGRLDLADPTLMDSVTSLLGFTPVGLAVWIWFQRFLHREADAYGESSEGATIRRIYTYALTATGLALLWIGVLQVMQVVLDWSLGGAAQAVGGIWVEPLARGLSLLTVGAPIWAYHWRTAQAIARREDSAGNSERASGPRKVYLYGVALVGALVILFYLAQVLYRLLLVVLGDPNAELFSLSAVGDLAQSLLAAVIWSVHVLALRDDGRLGTEPPALPAPTLDERRDILQARIIMLEQDLAALRAEMAALDNADASDDPTG